MANRDAILVDLRRRYASDPGFRAKKIAYARQAHAANRERRNARRRELYKKKARQPGEPSLREIRAMCSELRAKRKESQC